MVKSTITCNLEGVIETYNEGAQKLFGYSPDEVVGKKRVSIFSPGLVVLQNVEGWLKTARDERVYEGKTVFVRKDGSTFPARIRITPTYKGDVMIGYCGVTEPIQETYSVPISLGTRILSWLVVMRAPFVSASLMAVLIGGAFAGTQLAADATFPVGNFLLALVGVLFLHLASNVFNDYFDWKSGTDQANADYFLKYSGGSRAIELGLIDLKGTLWLAIGLILTSVLIGLYLTVQVGTGVLVFGLLGAFAGYFYTAPPLRLVARKGLGELFIALAFGPLITAGTAYVVTGSFDPTGLTFLIGVPMGLLTANILIINQIPDADSDATTGKNHLVVVLGKEKTPLLYGLVLFLAIVTHSWITLTAPGATWIWWIPAIVMLVQGGYIVRYMIRHLASRELVRGNVNTIMLDSFYGILFAAALTFFS